MPLGDDPELSVNGTLNTGIPQGGERRGMVITSTGLIFVNSRDGKIRALDADSGKLLWSASLPAGTEGLPTLYEEHGREYLAVPAAAPKIGARGKPEISTQGVGERAYVVFALPKK